MFRCFPIEVKSQLKAVRMEDTGLGRQREEDTSVNRDAMSWSRLEPGICDMIYIGKATVLGTPPTTGRMQRLELQCTEKSATQSLLCDLNRSWGSSS